MTLSSFLTGLFWAAANLAVIGLAGASLAGLLGPLWLPLDNLAHFRVQYFALLVPLALIQGLHRSKWLFGAALVFAVLNLVLLIPLYLRPAHAYAAASDQTYRLYSANLLRNNTQYDWVSQQILEYDPDLILLTEFTPTWETALQPVLKRYAYAARQPDQGYFGLAIFSKFPLAGSRVEYYGGATVPSIITTVGLPDGELVFVGTHPLPPRGASRIALRNQQMLAMAKTIGALSGPRMIAGDLNSSSFSPFFWDWLRHSGLNDSRAGYGVQVTWPADGSRWLRLALATTLDHVLVSSEIQVKKHSVAPFNGSDHLPVILDFSLKTNTPKDTP